MLTAELFLITVILLVTVKTQHVNNQVITSFVAPSQVMQRRSPTWQLSSAVHNPSAWTSMPVQSESNMATRLRR